MNEIKKLNVNGTEYSLNVDVIEGYLDSGNFYKTGLVAPDYVEIGGLKWATMNIGANSVTDTGLYFQWGDTQGYTASEVGSGSGQKPFNWSDYKFNPSGDGQTFTKYNSSDGKTVLDLEDDGVRANWGGAWRMPTTAEFQALGTATTSEWTADYEGSGVAGHVITSNTDSSKKLFFPVVGRALMGDTSNVSTGGFFWSSSLHSSNVRSYYMNFNSSKIYWQSDSYRYYGFPLRGVWDGEDTPTPTIPGYVQVTPEQNKLYIDTTTNKIYRYDGSNYVETNVIDDEAKVIAAAFNEVGKKVIESTWAEVKALRDSAQLIPGMWYQITDYTPVAEEYVISMGQPFDILVLATGNDTVSETARAKGKPKAQTANVKLYKTHIDEFPDEVDEDDYFLLYSTMEYDGETKYMWRKYEEDKETDWFALTDIIPEVDSLELPADGDNYLTIIPINGDGDEYGHDDDVMVRADYYEPEGGGDETDYFALVDAWKVWYCLDNDATRFPWVSLEQSHGVVYRVFNGEKMILVNPYDTMFVDKDGVLRFSNYKAVDVGDGLMFADRNVGAESETDEGLYFQWGDIEGFSKDSGRYCYGERNDERDWSGDYGRTHGSELGDAQNIPVDPYFDAARKYMGAPWRMPTSDDFARIDEFADESEWVESYKGSSQNGILCTFVNGNKLFFPAAGRFDRGIKFYGNNGSYWSSSHSSSDIAYDLGFESSGVFPDNEDSRCYGYSVRACYKESDRFVDLGLPSGTKWATCNIGAKKPEDAGLFFSWGNTGGRTESEGYSFGQSNYNSSGGHNLSDNIPVNATYDAAVNMLGSKWRMPTEHDFEELIDNCKLVWIDRNGVYGRLFISKVNGRSVFFPASGGFNGTSHYNVGSIGFYWSSTFYSSNNAWRLNVDSGNVNVGNDLRYCGYSVRAVQD